MSIRRGVLFAVIALVVAISCFGSDIPKGLDQIFKGVEKGRPFHPLWPPISGQNLVGTIVIARAPGKPEAMFETIESPDYRNQNSAGTFEVKQIPIRGGSFGKTTDVGVDVAFSQLDSIANALKSVPSATSFLGNNSASTGDSGNASATTKSASTKSGNTTQSTSGASTDSTRTATGVDFAGFNHATVTVPSLRVTYYTLSTLRSMEDKSIKGALNTLGQETLSEAGKGWIVSRCLIADSLVYELTSNDKVDASFLAKVFAWLPGVSVRYKNDKTITISTTSPVVLGYKLWRPSAGPEGAAAQQIDVETLSVGAKTIEAILNGKE